MSAELAPLLFREQVKIAEHPGWTPQEQTLALAKLLEQTFLEATKQEQLVFSTLFARISYAGHLFHFSSETLQVVHQFRRIVARVRNGFAATDRDARLGQQALAESVQALFQSEIPATVRALFPKAGEWRFEPTETTAFKRSARIVAFADDPEARQLIAVDAEHPEKEIRVQYGIPERNDNFSPSILVLRQVLGFPTSIQLHEVEIDRNGLYRPRILVLEPDYLMDVSAIAECFKEHGSEPFYHLVKKFLPYELTPAILLGNVANFFLDRLLNEPQAPYADLLRESFRLYPFAYAPMTDKEVRDVSAKAQKHYLNLKNMATGGLAKQQIEPAHSVLEPTFYSDQYGLQGRLDLFYRLGEKNAIVELKSGQPFRPNAYGIQRSHFTQTLLYDLLVRSVFGAETDPAKYILYSGVDVNVLRFAPTVAPEQWEALQLRNQLLGVERLLARITPGEERVPLLNRLTAKSGEGKGFLQRDFARFEGVYAQLSRLEKKYFNAFAGFIARESLLAKIGEAESDTAKGNATLWRNSFAEKQQAFSILSHLEIQENKADQNEALIRFRKTEKTNPLANFRIGDIAVLYPARDENSTVLDAQVIKCTITALSKETVEVQLRYRQFNLYPFETQGYWNLEPDVLDTGFVNMYRGLFEWAAQTQVRRERVLLPLSQAPSASSSKVATQPGLTPEQQQIFEKIVRSPHFFLLWGPPGTGKTSVMLRSLAQWVLEASTDNLLLLAYTNRAVDEICEALESLGPHMREQYLRIGSQHATSERFRAQLLQQRIAGVGNRVELREVLEKRRIFVGTVASFSSNDGLLQVKKFQRVVIDEASQLLEPQLVGLLTRFDHFVLIGDHRQLPAVTTQTQEYTRVEDPELNSIGLTDLRDSYFERLFRRCTALNMHWAIGSLSHQGRMHADIMAFPNEYFYHGLLQTLPEAIGNTLQYEALNYQLPGGEMPDWQRRLSQQRVVFLPTPDEDFIPGQKTSAAEARVAAELVQFFKKLYALNGKRWDPQHSLGIITPWRAQIAQIRAALSEAELDADEITIDTVERYQGGAREVILLSTCVHTEQQLQSLVNLSGEGVDRKLNVALTRARSHVVVLGKAAILCKDERYRAFVAAYGPEQAAPDAL